MKIAIPSSTPDMQGTVEQKLGAAAYMVIVETNDMSLTVLDGPKQSGPGAGIAAISSAVDAGARVILAGYVAQHIADALKKQSIDVVSGCSGTVGEAVAEYVQSLRSDTPPKRQQTVESAGRSQWIEAGRKGLRQFYSMVPRLIGVVLLLGLFRGLVDEQTLLKLMSGSTLLNAFWGASLGSVLAGNPVNSYVIGDNLLNAGVGLAGVAGLMMAWVTVGVIQLPVEAAALGKCFALVRNLAAFAMAILFSLVFAMLGGGLL